MLLISAFLLRRITPARAGKTLFDSNLVTFYGDHPRSCGKDSGLQRRAVCRPGSPPLVRERRADWGEEDPNDGITPARAGRTSPLNCGCGGSGDHPRSCGKDLTLSWKSCVASGSPPLVRERPRAGFRCNTPPVDHPRSCGKDVTAIWGAAVGWGSPPLVRERQKSRCDRHGQFRITPARAGKTC